MTEDPPNGDALAIALEPEGKRLSRAEFQGLSDMPPLVGMVCSPWITPAPGGRTAMRGAGSNRVEISFRVLYAMSTCQPLKSRVI